MRAAIWARVSTDDQDVDNQVRQLQEAAYRRQLEVVKIYQVAASAFTGRHNPLLATVAEAGRRGEFDVLLVWSLDRLSRQGPLHTLQIIDRLKRFGVRVVSLQEPFTELPHGMDDVFIAFAAWVARFESVRRSERTKAGMERAKAEGRITHRPKGAKDKKPRKRGGYFDRMATWPQ